MLVHASTSVIRLRVASPLVARMRIRSVFRAGKLMVRHTLLLPVIAPPGTVAQAVPGNRVGDLGAAAQAYVESRGLQVVRDFVGHGVGRRLHEPPQVPNFGTPGTGPRLKAGMVLAIEPMVNLGTAAVEHLEDGWTAVTQDGRRSAHFEHTVAVTENGPEILTLPPGESLTPSEEPA